MSIRALRCADVIVHFGDTVLHATTDLPLYFKANSNQEMLYDGGRAKRIVNSNSVGLFVMVPILG